MSRRTKISLAVVAAALAVLAAVLARSLREIRSTQTTAPGPVPEQQSPDTSHPSPGLSAFRDPQRRSLDFSLAPGQRGPEAVRLPQGSMVYSAGDSARMMGGSSGQGRDVNVRVKVERPTERGMIDLVMSMIRFEVENAYGGDVQRALGGAR